MVVNNVKNESDENDQRNMPMFGTRFTKGEPVFSSIANVKKCTLRKFDLYEHFQNDVRKENTAFLYNKTLKNFHI